MDNKLSFLLTYFLIKFELSLLISIDTTKVTTPTCITLRTIAPNYEASTIHSNAFLNRIT